MKQHSILEYFGRGLDHLELSLAQEPKKLICTMKPSCFTPMLLNNIYTLQCRIASSTEHKNYFNCVEWRSKNQHVFSLGLDLPFIHSSLIQKNERNIETYLKKFSDVLSINHHCSELDLQMDVFCKGLTSQTGLNFALLANQITAHRVKLITPQNLFGKAAQFSLYPENELEALEPTFSQPGMIIVPTAAAKSAVQLNQQLKRAITHKMTLYSDLSGKDLQAIKSFIACHPKFYT